MNVDIETNNSKNNKNETKLKIITTTMTNAYSQARRDLIIGVYAGRLCHIFQQ